MFRGIESSMDKTLKNQLQGGHFDQAKELGQRLERLRSEFGGLQEVNEANQQDRETAFFRKAKKMADPMRHKIHTEEENEVEKQNLREISSIRERFRIQKENQTLELSRIEKPRMKYSRRRMELKNAEVRLCNLKQYDEAKNVRRMLREIDKVEEAEFNKVFDDKIALKEAKLESKQRADFGRLEEKLSAHRWKDYRRREYEQKVAAQNFTNKERDMKHEHMVNGMIRPELTVKPSALMTKRNHFKHTSAYYRGRQLLDKCKGKKNGDAVFIESLCGTHEFGGKKLSGTLSLE